MTLLLIRDAEVDGRVQDVLIQDGYVRWLGSGASAPPDATIDAQGGALLPGLVDHHLHLFATAAHQISVPCGPPHCRNSNDLRRALTTALSDAEGWVRGVGYFESVAGPLDRWMLDGLYAERPVRIQHRSGAMWMLNSAAVRDLELADAGHPGIERADDGTPTGRLWRADDLLRRAFPNSSVPSLSGLGRLMVKYGITAVTDAGPDLDDDTVQALIRAVDSGELPQRLMLLGVRPDLLTLEHPRVSVGPYKIVLADSGLPPADVLADLIGSVHAAGRPVALHCVSVEALMVLLSAFDSCGSMEGDRIEHGALIPDFALPDLVRRGLSVVTQPGFIADRGDDYLRNVPAFQHEDLYRHAGLRASGVDVYLSSDAPYGPLDPWQNMRTAVDRRAPSGSRVAPAESIAPREALAAYQGWSNRGRGPRPITVGKQADLVLMSAPLSKVLDELSADLVRLAFIHGVPQRV